MTAAESPSTLWPRRIAAVGGITALAAAALQWYGADGPWTAICAGAAFTVLAGAIWPWTGGDDAVSSGKPRTAAADNYQQLLAEIEKYKQLERELTAAKHAAEAATMAKGEFLATMSHEIRTPLNGIIPLLDILLSAPLAPEHREYIQTAFGSARQLLRIVDDILDYSKLEANKLELENVGLNLKDVLEGVMRLMDKAAESKGLRLSLNIDSSVRLAVRGDPVRLRQILTNLLSNAVKFTERGSVVLTLLRRGETRTQHELRFEVRDSGVGITPENAARLFQPFSQADASTTRTYGGTGLGLVICKRIVDLMGGQIGVESQPGRGSLFWFQVPMLKAHGDIGARKRELNGARVLTVTAHAAQQRRFDFALPSWGALAVQVSNTQEAIAKLRTAVGRSSNWAFDLMLIDAPSIPSTVLALHRSVMRETTLEDLRLVYLRGDEHLPKEILENERVRILARDIGDNELRQQLSRLLESEPRTSGTSGVETASNAEATARLPDRLPANAPLAGHVLLVEDNPVNRQVAQRLLTLAGLTYECAENGHEALECLTTGRYDVVLMDCQMPVMDGYTATRQRRALESQQKLPHLPIIAMTANAMVGDREKCLAAGMDDYLSKPLNRALLEQTLRQWLPAVSVKQAAAARPPNPAARGTHASSSGAAAVPTRAGDMAVIATARNDLSASPASGAASSAPVLNREIVDDLREIMGDEFIGLVKVFLEDAPRSIIKLEQAALHPDINGLIGPAHSLKSTSANLGALALSSIARTIEQGARQQTLSDPLRHVTALVQEFRRVETALRGFLG